MFQNNFKSDLYVSLKRVVFLQDRTLGHLSINQSFYCDTLEPAFSASQCEQAGGGAVPIGNYIIDFRYSEKFKISLPHVCCFEKRFGIFFHQGNFPSDTEGCILLGHYNPSENCLVDSMKYLSEFVSVVFPHYLSSSKIYFQISQD